MICDPIFGLQWCNPSASTTCSPEIILRWACAQFSVEKTPQQSGGKVCTVQSEMGGWIIWECRLAKTAPKGFRHKKLGSPQPPTRSKPFTADNTVISGACRLGQRSLPLVSIYPHIHTFIPSFHPSIHPSIHPHILQTHPKDLSSHTQQASGQKMIQCLDPTRQDEVFFEGSTCQQAFASLRIYSEKIWIFFALTENFTKPYN